MRRPDPVAEPVPAAAVERPGVPATPSDTAARGYRVADAPKTGFWSQVNEVFGGRG